MDESPALSPADHWYVTPVLARTIEALERLAHTGAFIGVIKGPAGSGKSLLLERLAGLLADDGQLAIAYLHAGESSGLLAGLAAAFDVPTDGNAAQTRRALIQHLTALHGSGRCPVALIDDAHHLSTLDLSLLIRLGLSADKGKSGLLNVILTGSGELDQRIAVAGEHLSRQRVYVASLPPLTEEESFELLARKTETLPARLQGAAGRRAVRKARGVPGSLIALLDDHRRRTRSLPVALLAATVIVVAVAAVLHRQLPDGFTAPASAPNPPPFALPPAGAHSSPASAVTPVATAPAARTTAAAPVIAGQPAATPALNVTGTGPSPAGTPEPARETSPAPATAAAIALPTPVSLPFNGHDAAALRKPGPGAEASPVPATSLSTPAPLDIAASPAPDAGAVPAATPPVDVARPDTADATRATPVPIEPDAGAADRATDSPPPSPVASEPPATPPPETGSEPALAPPADVPHSDATVASPAGTSQPDVPATDSAAVPAADAAPHAPAQPGPPAEVSAPQVPAPEPSPSATDGDVDGPVSATAEAAAAGEPPPAALPQPATAVSAPVAPAPAPADAAAPGLPEPPPAPPARTAPVVPPETPAPVRAAPPAARQTVPAPPPARPTPRPRPPAAAEPLAQAPDTAWVVQLAATESNTRLRSYAARNELSSYVILHTRRNGQDWYVLLLGGYHPNQAAAQAALARLPEGLRSETTPWVRSVRSLRKLLPRADDPAQ